MHLITKSNCISNQGYKRTLPYLYKSFWILREGIVYIFFKTKVSINKYNLLDWKKKILNNQYSFGVAKRETERYWYQAFKMEFYFFLCCAWCVGWMFHYSFLNKGESQLKQKSLWEFTKEKSNYNVRWARLSRETKGNINTFQSLVSSAVSSILSIALAILVSSVKFRIFFPIMLIQFISTVNNRARKEKHLNNKAANYSVQQFVQLVRDISQKFRYWELGCYFIYCIVFHVLSPMVSESFTIT